MIPKPSSILRTMIKNPQNLIIIGQLLMTVPFGSAQCLYIGSCNRLRNKRNKSYLANAS